jgi:glycerate kinase
MTATGVTATHCGFSPAWGDDPAAIVLAFDSFKGSLDAREACALAERAIINRLGESVAVSSFPMADGGEGSLELVLAGDCMETITVDVVDALGRPVRAEYGFDPARREAHIEIARAAGLPQVSDVPLQPLDASTAGVGRLATHALGRGARRIVLYLGGSATTDAGTGLLSALGVRFLDSAGQPIASGGGPLAAVVEIDITGLRSDARDVEWVVVTDVDAPLLGPLGAARVFGPQKGATPSDIDYLEQGLGQVASVLRAQTGVPVGELPGTGAAGGVAALLAAIAEVTFVSGGAFFAERSGLAAALSRAALVITGEGRLDSQSFTGKVVGTVTNLALAAPTPPAVAVVAGQIDRTGYSGHPGITAAFSLADGPADLSALTDTAGELLSRRCADVAALFVAGTSSPTATEGSA